MKISNVWLVWILIGFGAGNARAGETPVLAHDVPPVVRKADLESLKKEALEKGQGLRAKRLEYEALRSKAVNAWLPSDPQVGLDVEGQPDPFKFSDRKNNEYMVMQTIPFPSTLFLKGLEASKQADIAYQRYKEAERDVLWHIEQPYYELFLARRTVSVLEENETLLEEMSKAVKARYESGNGSQQDWLKIQIESSKNQIEIFNGKEKVHLAGAHFAHTLNESLETVFEISERAPRRSLEITRAEAVRIALEKRPELLALRHGVERAKVSRSLANTEWLPEITLRYEGREFKGSSGIEEHDTFIGFSVPVWSLLKGIGGAWKGADLDVKSAEAMTTQMKNDILLKIHEAYSRISAAQNALRVYETSVLPQAKLQVETALAAYASGRQDVLELIDTQRTFKASQIDYQKFLAEYEMALSDLRFAAGDDLT